MQRFLLIKINVSWKDKIYTILNYIIMPEIEILNNFLYHSLIHLPIMTSCLWFTRNIGVNDKPKSNYVVQEKVIFKNVT